MSFLGLLFGSVSSLSSKRNPIDCQDVNIRLLESVVSLGTQVHNAKMRSWAETLCGELGPRVIELYGAAG